MQVSLERGAFLEGDVNEQVLYYDSLGKLGIADLSRDITDDGMMIASNLEINYENVPDKCQVNINCSVIILLCEMYKIICIYQFSVFLYFSGTPGQMVNVYSIL